jgi:hypothetical protein
LELAVSRRSSAGVKSVLIFTADGMRETSARHGMRP